MKTYFKYLIIGWSIVSVVLVVLSFQIMKRDIIKEEYVIKMPVLGGKIVTTEELFGMTSEEFGKRIKEKYPEYSDLEDKDLARRVLEKIKKRKELKIEFEQKTEPLFYIFFPLYAFLIWALPVLVLSLVGLIFSRK